MDLGLGDCSLEESCADDLELELASRSLYRFDIVRFQRTMLLAKQWTQSTHRFCDRFVYFTWDYSKSGRMPAVFRHEQDHQIVPVELLPWVQDEGECQPA